jgi:hypothetical protein
VRAQLSFFQKVIADLDVIRDQYRHPRIIQADQFRGRININFRDINSEFGTQALQRLRHPGTQMAATADIDGQLIQIFTGRNRPERLIIIRNLDSKKGRAAATLQQQRHCLAGRQFLDQLLKLFNVLDRFVIDTQDNITLANAGL